MTTKAEKKIRQEAVLKAIDNGTFDKNKLADKFHVIERTIRRDLNEIADSMGPIDERRLIIKQKALDRLPQRIPKMSDANLIKLGMSGETQRIEAHTEGTQKVIVEIKDYVKSSDKD